jgi:hypothetical protein
MIVGDFYTLLSPRDRTLRQKIDKESSELNDTIDQLNFTAIYRVFHPAAVQCTFVSATHGTFSKIDHILGHKANLDKYKLRELPVSY